MVSSEDPVNKWSVSSFQFHIQYRLFIEPEKMERVIRIIFSTMERNDNSGKSTGIIEMKVSSTKTDLWITSRSI